MRDDFNESSDIFFRSSNSKSAGRNLEAGSATPTSESSKRNLSENRKFETILAPKFEFELRQQHLVFEASAVAAGLPPIRSDRSPKPLSARLKQGILEGEVSLYR